MSLRERFAAGYPFPLDDFQARAVDALAAGKGVLVCAPTGAGKTVVGEFAVWLALERGEKAFYTTPIKALSNQKFGDFIARYGASRVGLLTGDNSINSDAPVVVMTTEVLRNMLYERSPALAGLGLVVLDEVHYLKDTYRGAVWEEVLIHLPEDVQVAALSATVSNADEFGAWLETVRGDTEVVIETARPVPLEHHYLVDRALHPMFVEERGVVRPNPALRRAGTASRDRRGGRRLPRDRRGREGRPAPRGRRPDRLEVIELLRRRGMLPCIAFIFSRAGCDRAVAECRRAGVRLTDAEERERIREYVSLRAAVLPDEDLVALGYEDWLDGLERGIAAHHAGLIPLFKETVEELFERALCKVVFATETLALGINMPARTVVIERPVKFTGEHHEVLSPADYTQLTGRAGRRGIDTVGYGVLLQQDDFSFDQVAALASARSYPLTSSFAPSYNMAVNLLRLHTRDEAIALLNRSFGQYLADRSVHRLSREIERNERYAEGYRRNVECDLGDFAEYYALAREAERERERSSAERRRGRAQAVSEAFGALRRGQVVSLRRGKRASLVAVLEVRRASDGEPAPVVLAEDRKVVRLAVRDFREPPGLVGEVRMPKGDSRSPAFRHEVARQLERMDVADARPIVETAAPAPAPPRVTAEAVESHPCHRCPDRAEHERWAERLGRIEADIQALAKRVRTRTETLGRTFARVVDVLDSFGYTAEGRLTDSGARLCRIYNESDLLLAEALERGTLDGLDAAELAAALSALVYETRSRFAPSFDYPTEATRAACDRLARIWREIRGAERQHSLELCREPDPGFVEQIYWWVREDPLEDVLQMSELSAGDFVRSAKQVWDLLKQLDEVLEAGPLRERVAQARNAVYRGVVAYSGAL